MNVSIGLARAGVDVGIPHVKAELLPLKGVFTCHDRIEFHGIAQVTDIDAAIIYMDGVSIGRIPLMVGVRARPGDNVEFAPYSLNIRFDDDPLPELSPAPVLDLPGGEFEGARMTPKPTECPHCGHIVFPGVLHLCEGEIR